MEKSNKENLFKIDNDRYEYERFKIKELKNNLNIADVGRNLIGLHFLKTSSGNFLRVEEHQSMLFDTKRNIALSIQNGKTLNVIDLVMEECGLSLENAKDLLISFYINSIPQEMVQYNYNNIVDKTEQYKGLQLPKQNDNNNIVKSYLTSELYLGEKLINRLIDEDRIFEDEYHNCVFVGYDVNEETKPVFACQVGTYIDSDYKKDCLGSLTKNGFFLKGFNGCEKLVISDRVVDALSYFSYSIATSETRTCDAHILGTSSALSIAQVLDYNLQNNNKLKSVNKIEVYLSNDEIGNVAWKELNKYLDDNNLSYNVTRPKYWEQEDGDNIKNLNDLLTKFLKNQELEIIAEIDKFSNKVKSQKFQDDIENVIENEVLS